MDKGDPVACAVLCKREASADKCRCFCRKAACRGVAAEQNAVALRDRRMEILVDDRADAAMELPVGIDADHGNGSSTVHQAPPPRPIGTGWPLPLQNSPTRGASSQTPARISPSAGERLVGEDRAEASASARSFRGSTRIPVFLLHHVHDTANGRCDNRPAVPVCERDDGRLGCIGRGVPLPLPRRNLRNLIVRQELFTEDIPASVNDELFIGIIRAPADDMNPEIIEFRGEERLCLYKVGNTFVGPVRYRKIKLYFPATDRTLPGALDPCGSGARGRR